MKKGLFQDLDPVLHFLSFIILIIISYLLATLVSIGGAFLFFGIGSFQEFAVLLQPIAENAPFLKYAQITQSLGLFLIPGLLFHYLFSGSAYSYIEWHRTKKGAIFVMVSLVMLLGLPLINYLGWLNSQIQLPDALEEVVLWMQEKEGQAEEMTQILLSGSSFGSLVVNLVVIAVIPALGEEILFRGGLQRLFQRRIKKPYVAICLTAFVFSAIHLQFLGFLPRLVLGVFLGYFYHWTRNLWVPIMAHFVNNAIGVIAFWAIKRGLLPQEVDQMGDGSISFPLMSAVLVGVLFTLIYKASHERARNQEGLSR